MAKRQKQPKKKAGPFLAAAFFCDSTIEDKQDGALSAIRLIDQVTVRVDPSAPPDFPSETQPIPVQVAGLLSFKTGDSPGEHAVRLDIYPPSGKKQTFFEKNVPLTPPPHGGANIRLRTAIGVVKGGLFWLHVYLDGKRVTQMPLQVVVQRAAAAAPSQPSEN